MKNLTIELTYGNMAELLNPNLGATTVIIPEMTAEMLKELCDQASTLVYTKAENTPKVEQHFSCCGEFAAGSIWVEIANQVTRGLQQSLNKLNLAHLLLEPLNFTDLALQNYAESIQGKNGIGPHRDQSGFINFVVVLLLRGPAAFFTCKDRAGSDAIEIRATPGNLIVMRGGGFAKDTLNRPMHFVGPIGKQGRLSFGLRQVTSNQEAAKQLRKCFSGSK